MQAQVIRERAPLATVVNGNGNGNVASMDELQYLATMQVATSPYEDAGTVYDFEAMIGGILPGRASALGSDEIADISIVDDSTIQVGGDEGRSCELDEYDVLALNVVLEREEFRLGDVFERYDDDINSVMRLEIKSSFKRVREIIGSHVENAMERQGSSRMTTYRLRDEIKVADLRPTETAAGDIDFSSPNLTVLESPEELDSIATHENDDESAAEGAELEVIKGDTAQITTTAGITDTPPAKRRLTIKAKVGITQRQNERLLDKTQKLRESLILGVAPDSATGVEVIDKLSDGQRSLAEFILFGGTVPDGIDRHIARTVLKRLAGKDELGDDGVKRRFAIVNAYLSGVAVNGYVGERQTEDKQTEDGTSQGPVASTTSTGRTKAGYTISVSLGKPAFGSDKAACKGMDPEFFFTERGESTKEPKNVCEGCAVREACLEHALENGEKFGIWGGTSERERRRLRISYVLAKRQAAEKVGQSLAQEGPVPADYEPTAEELEEVEEELAI